jgi:hypothetical protein
VVEDKQAEEQVDSSPHQQLGGMVAEEEVDNINNLHHNSNNLKLKKLTTNRETKVLKTHLPLTDMVEISP